MRNIIPLLASTPFVDGFMIEALGLPHSTSRFPQPHEDDQVYTPKEAGYTKYLADKKYSQSSGGGENC